MKKLYLLSFLLPLWTLLPLWGLGGRLFAAVQVKSISTDYANKRVTFALSWAAGTRNATHLSKVWVLVDYQPVTNPNTTGAWQRATVVSATATTGTVSGNTGQGFYLQGTDGAFSSTVTVTLSGVPAKFNWCATATDYPPNVTATGGTYTLHGTAPFTLVAADGVSTQVVNGKSIAASALTVAPVIIRDATGCPGVFCPYTGTDLLVDATHICQQRTSGAQNWEAYIKDSRDNRIYRIVQMPDNNWWLADNLNYAGSGTQSSLSYCGRYYTWAQTIPDGISREGAVSAYQSLCPNGWFLPTPTVLDKMILSLGQPASVNAYVPLSATSNGARAGGTDLYGFSWYACGHSRAGYYPQQHTGFDDTRLKTSGKCDANWLMLHAARTGTGANILDNQCGNRGWDYLAAHTTCNADGDFIRCVRQ